MKDLFLVDEQTGFLNHTKPKIPTSNSPDQFSLEMSTRKDNSTSIIVERPIAIERSIVKEQAPIQPIQLINVPCERKDMEA